MKRRQLNIEKLVNEAAELYSGNGSYKEKFNYYYDLFNFDVFAIYHRPTNTWLDSGRVVEPGQVLNDFHEGGWDGFTLYECLTDGTFNVKDDFWIIDFEILGDVIVSMNAETIEEIVIWYLKQFRKNGKFNGGWEAFDESIDCAIKKLNEIE